MFVNFYKQIYTCTCSMVFRVDGCSESPVLYSKNYDMQIEEVAALRNIIQQSDIHSLVEDRYRRIFNFLLADFRLQIICN